MNVRISLTVLALATLLKVVYTVLGASESLQRGTFVGLAMLVLTLPNPKRETRKKNERDQATRLAR
jgi:hypothetical protein